MAEKQVRVDNWGIFLLQRLQHFFNRTDFCDLTLQFENNVQLKVHRLVVNACTEYFQMLEQSCEFIDDCLIMPDDLQPDVVLPIVNFMYTGQLEYRSSNYDKLYATAELMNMTVLTKLLDAQKNPISPLPKSLNKKASPIPVTWNLQGKKIVPKTMDPDLPEPLPGRKLPIWKRKNVPGSNYRPFDVKRHIGEVVPLIKPFSSISVDNTPRPTRFELPEDDSAQIIFESSFDDISYESKPLATPIKEEPGINSPTFEDIKKTSSKRPYSEISPDSKRVNLQEVKEYLQEHRLRTDYILNDDSTVTQSEYEYFSDDNNSNSQSKNSECIFGTPSKSILKSSDDGQSQSKRVRFNFEDKENTDGSKPTAKVIGSKIKTTIESPSALNHAKIISEVLKKYPHLVKKNKNIKLKIMQKNTTSPGPHPIQLTKASSKVSYVVRKPEKQQTPQENEVTTVWECHACSATLNSRMYFDSHYEYRKHLFEVHNEKIDLKVCEHCGFKSAKNNLLMYHLQTSHNIKPPAKYRFPQCDRCDYVAVTDSMLVKHKATTHTDEIVCKECKSVLPDCHAFVKHSYMKNHNTNMQFDCKYCPKKFWRPVNILKHMRTYHKTEYSQHGFDDIVLEPAVPNEAVGEKIQILSNVKLEKQNAENHQIISNIQNLEPSSEAEALSNVASGIAASLGLVDTIVVLDDNQFVLHPTEEIQTQQSSKQEQFIVPDLRDETISNFNAQNNLSEQSTIISEANIISNSGITSTDELVMVLTDHDYSDGNEQIITGDNSNIVVLYSHPVDGQQTQYISQQGNIILNPQTGMLEMAGNQIHVTTSEAISIDTHTNSNLVQFKNEPEESIEMIQREINSHVEQTAQFISGDVEVQQTQSEEMTETIVETESDQRPLEMPDLSEPACTNEEPNNTEMPILNDERTQVEMSVQQTEELSEKTNTEDNATETEEIEQNIPENQENQENGQNHENQENEENHETRVNVENQENENDENQENENDENQENENYENQENENDENQENENDENQENENDENQENENYENQENDEQGESESIHDATESSLKESEITNEEENIQSMENIPSELNKDEHDSSMNEPAEIEVMGPAEIEVMGPGELAVMCSTGIEQIENIIPNAEPMEIDEPYETLLEDSKTDDSINEENLESSNTSVEVEQLTNNSQVEVEAQDNNTLTENEIEQKEVNDEPMEVDSRLMDDIGKDEVDHELQNVEQNVEELTELTKNTNQDSETEKVDESVEEEKLDVASSQTVQSEKEIPEEELTYEDNTNGKESKNAVEEEEEEPKGEKSNDNVTALVSDWCDEDSGLLSADRENTVVEEQQPQKKPSEKVIRKGAHGKASNPKITKLLDDWDDGDTDSQHSGVDSNQKPANESQIDNLIDDWDDDE